MKSVDPTILLTIDVEDWFQVENFKQWIPFSSWDSHELRVEKNTHRLLDLFDSFDSVQTQTSVSRFPIKATFFILGWIAKCLPHLVREIHNRGHEIASHGKNHHLCSKQSHKELKKDLADSKNLLEDIIGHQVYGFRAPSFAINRSILKIVEDCGYLYDSSYNSFSLNYRYGRMDFSKNKKQGIAIQLFKAQNPKFEILYELPISNFKFGNMVLPFGGGAYFRLIPFILFKTGVKKILKKQNAFLFYLHPWEIDTNQPKVKDSFLIYKFRHYTNLGKTYPKLSLLIKQFCDFHFTTCWQYLEKIEELKTINFE